MANDPPQFVIYGGPPMLVIYRTTCGFCQLPGSRCQGVGLLAGWNLRRYYSGRPVVTVPDGWNHAAEEIPAGCDHGGSVVFRLMPVKGDLETAVEYAHDEPAPLPAPRRRSA